MLALILILLFLILVKVFQIYSYWTKRGVKTANILYSFNNYTQGILRLHHPCKIFKSIYDSHRDKRYVGFYNFIQPVLLIFDPILIKRIMINDFQTFPDRCQEASDIDEIWNQALHVLPYADGWRELRATVNAFFTTAKLKLMFPLMQKCSSSFMDHLKSMDVNAITLNDAFLRYANDVIGSTAFGFTVDSFKNKHNDIWLIGKQITAVSPLSFFKLVVYRCCPFILKMLNFKILPNKTYLLIKKHIQESLRLRQQQNIIRPDIVHFLNQAKSKNVEINLKNDSQPMALEITDDIITAQIATLLFGGVNTVSSILMFLSYELANNPHVQEKLYMEIIKKIDKNITFDNLQSLKYLDKIILECCRMYPGSSILERTNVKPFFIQAETLDEKDLHLPKHSRIWIPVHTFYMDNAHFPNPEKFDPDRFDNETNNSLIFMPFGKGFRRCIGEKLAMIEIKLLLVNILQKYEFSPPKVPIKIPYFSCKHVFVGLKCRN